MKKDYEAPTIEQVDFSLVDFINYDENSGGGASQGSEGTEPWSL